MHEVAVAQEILALVAWHVPRARAAEVRQVHVRIGELAGVLPASLDFCFAAAVAGTPFSRATLVVEPVPASARCLTCGHAFATRAPGAGCPACAGHDVRMVSGRELHVDAVDLDDEPAPEPALAGAGVAAERGTP